MNIPIYRAKKIDSDEYIEFNSYYELNGFYYAIEKVLVKELNGWFSEVHIPLTHEIDPTTLAIYFPDMLDSQGNKIFASLNEDGNGGDMFECSIIFRKQENIFNGTFIYRNRMFTTDNYCVNQSFAKKFKAIGIQK